MKKIILAAVLLVQASAFARDTKNFRSLGFSDNGQYYAFVQSVVQDGSGFPSAEADIVDVAHNKLVKRESVVLEADNATEAMAVQQVLAKLQLSRYGIDKKNSGRTLWIRAQTDLSSSTTAEFTTDTDMLWPRYTVTAKDIPTSNNSNCMADQVAMLQVSLSKEVRGDVTTQELQRDTHLPASRRCSVAYEIRQVIKYKNSLTVIMRYESPGFEGRDLEFMAVTAQGVL